MRSLRACGAAKWSPLTEGRGLKYHLTYFFIYPVDVAPHGGAWIEMQPNPTDTAPAQSPLTEGRGLK